MRPLATKQSSKDSSQPKRIGTNHVPVLRTLNLSTVATGSAMLQRKSSCACGGGCPRCQDNLNIQTKLKVSEPGDQYEQEADRIADRVMRMPEPPIQPQMHLEVPQAKRMQEVPPSLESHVQQRQGLGQPIAETTRTKMESFFGADFSNVNIHTDNQAVQMNQSLNAQAFTVGNDIFFNFGKYTPGRATGDHLLAHELTHVIQQTEGRQPFIQRKDDEEQGCGGQVGDSFKLIATMPASPSQYSSALIVPRNQPDEFGKIYHIDDWLNDYMVIIDIPKTDTFNYNLVRVMHCENLEILEAPQSKHIVEVRESNFGPGTVTTFDNCNQVEFEPEDKSKPRKVYILETWSKPGVEDLTGYVLQGSNDGFIYNPADLGRYLRVHLVKDKCGMPNPQEPSTNEGEGEKLP